MIGNSFNDGNPLFALSILLVFGFVLGHLAEKLKLPRLMGQILAGILVGPYGLDLFTHETFHSFGPITDFALCIFGLTMGTHLILRLLHNAGKRVVYILICQIVLIPLLSLCGFVLWAGHTVTSMSPACCHRSGHLAEFHHPPGRASTFKRCFYQDACHLGCFDLVLPLWSCFR